MSDANQTGGQKFDRQEVAEMFLNSILAWIANHQKVNADLDGEYFVRILLSSKVELEVPSGVSREEFEVMVRAVVEMATPEHTTT